MQKLKTCRLCKSKFRQFNSMVPVCLDCAPGYALEKAKKKKDKEEKTKYAKLKRNYYANDIKTRKKAAKDACHAYIRLRDEKEPCISCGRYDHEIDFAPVGGKWDAGHYRSRGACPELRFNEYNIHKQCKSCNGGSAKWPKKNQTVTQQYRENLIKKIGLNHVEFLDGPHELIKLDCEDLKEIEIYYKNKIKELNKPADHKGKAG